jgi:predicted DNA-binding mobile mystery protein A
MSVKNIISKQYQDKVNIAATKMRNVGTPLEGWLRTARKALGMSVAQLARRLGVTRAQVYNTEKGELNGSVTIKTLQNMAEAMRCRLVYAVVPEHDVEKILAARAKKKAMKMVEEANKHMALEEQALSEKQIAFEVERLQREMLKDLPINFWNDED